MYKKSIIRRIALRIISWPKAHVHISSQQVNYSTLLNKRRIVITGGQNE